MSKAPRITDLMNAQQLEAMNPLSKPKLPKVPRERVFVRLPEPLKLEMDAIAEDQKTSFNSVMIAAAVEFIQNRKLQARARRKK